MTSDFNQRSEPRPFGSSDALGTPSDITAGGTRSGFSGSGTTTGAVPSVDASRLKDALGREAGAAKAEAGAAVDSVKETAAGLAATAKEKAAEGVEKGKAEITSSLGDFAAAVRRASDELGQRDQSMAAGLVREVASGLEQASNSIKGTSIQDLTRSVASFARRQPTTFLIGAALAGIALGRFARASGEHAEPAASGAGAADPDRFVPARPMGRSYAQETSGASYAGTSSAGTYSGGGSSATVTQPSPEEGAYPTTRRAPAEGPSDAALGRGSGSFNPSGGSDVR